MSERAGGPQQHKLLRIYLNDHLMGATAAVQLARRAWRNNRGTPLGAYLGDLAAQLRDDRLELERVLATLGVKPDRLKVAVAVAGERLGRLKLNGSLLHYSDLSRVVELEGLLATVQLNERLWLALRDVATADGRLAAHDFDRLVERARSHLESLEKHRRHAVARAFAGATSGTGTTGG